MDKKVILINSPIYNKKVADKEDYLPPFGLGYIATQLQKENINTEIIDAVYLNLTAEELLELIRQKRPDVVGINIFSINFDIVKEIIEKCTTPVKFIVGGKSTKFLYKDIINFKTNNEIVVTIGEGEYITPRIVEDNVIECPLVDEDKRKVYSVNKDSKYFPHDLDKSNLDRSLFWGREITNKYGQLEAAIVTSRECLYNCAFCGGARSLNKDVTARTRSMDNVKKEIQDIITQNPKVKSIRFLDDLFLRNEKSIKDCIEMFSNLNLNFRAMAHVLSLRNSLDLLPKLAKSGCKELEVGIESGSEKIRDLIHKKGSINDVKIVVKSTLDAGINVKGYFIYGLPDETKSDVMETYMLAKELFQYSQNTKGKFFTSAFQFRPYHGTELYNKINKKISYSHNDNLNNLSGRQQFNFTAGNFSDCNLDLIEELIISTNKMENLEYEFTENSTLQEM